MMMQTMKEKVMQKCNAIMPSHPTTIFSMTPTWMMMIRSGSISSGNASMAT